MFRTTIPLLFLWLAFSCQSGKETSQSKIDSLRRADSIRRDDSIRRADATPSGTSGTSTTTMATPDALTLTSVIVWSDTTEGSAHAGTLIPLSVVPIVEKSPDRRKAAVNNCGLFYDYRVRLPDGETGWVSGSELAFANDYLGPITTNFGGVTYVLFAATMTDLESSQVEADCVNDRWSILFYEPGEQRLYPVTIAETDLGCKLRNGDATVEFFSDMTYPSVETLSVGVDRVDIVVKIAVADGSSFKSRFFIVKSGNRFEAKGCQAVEE